MPNSFPTQGLPMFMLHLIETAFALLLAKFYLPFRAHLKWHLTSKAFSPLFPSRTLPYFVNMYFNCVLVWLIFSSPTIISSKSTRPYLFVYPYQCLDRNTVFNRHEGWKEGIKEGRKRKAISNTDQQPLTFASLN